MKEETKQKISRANKGRVFSDEWRKNLSIAHKGQVSWRKGKKFVDEKTAKQKRKVYRKMWSLKNKDTLLEQNRRWKRANREKIAARARLRYQNNKQKELDRIRLNKYGISGDEFRAILKKQKNKCPICNRTIAKNLSVDHNHTTGKIRGIICNQCNLAIANADDSPDRLRALAQYLDERS